MSDPMSAFIPIEDGWTEAGYIAESPRMHPAVRFQFRPVLVSERSAIAREYDRRPHEVAKVNAEHLARKLASWNLPLPTTADNILRLRPRLFDRLLAVVFGNESSDLDPDASPTAPLAQPFDEARQRREEKN